MKISPAVLRTMLLILTLIGVARSLPAYRASAAEVRPLDLAALSLTPEDIAEVGLEGFGSDYGWLQTREDYAAMLVRDDAISLELATSYVDEMGLLRIYYLPLSRVIEGGKFEDIETLGVWVTILEFETETDTQVMFDRSLNEIAEDGREIVEGGNRRIGEDSVLTRSTAEDADTGDPMASLRLEFYTGTLYVAVDLYDVARDGEFSAPVRPALELVEALAERVMDRIESAGTEPGPSLGVQTVRLTAGDGSVVTVADRYTAIAGKPHRNYAESDDALAGRADRMARDRMLSSYVVQQDVWSTDTRTPGDPHLSVRLYQFEDDGAAAGWLEDTAYDRFAAEDYITKIAPIDLARDLGDSAIGASYEGVEDGAEMAGHLVWVQVDDVVARITLDAAEPLDLDVIAELAETQADCLLGASCEAVEVPSELT